MLITLDNYISEIKNKNPDALSFVTLTYGNLIFKLSYTYLKSKESAEECLNDVLLKIWQHIDDFTYEDCKFKNWIASIVKNTAIDMIRKNKKNILCISDECIDIEDSLNLEDIILTKENYTSVCKKILDLKDLDRNIIIHRFFLGKSLKEIGDLYSISPKTVYSKIFRIREQLKEDKNY